MKRTEPGLRKSFVEPKAMVLFTFLAALYTHVRCARLKGSSS